MSGADVVERYLQIMNELDIAALADLLTDDVVVRLPYAPDPIPRTTEGKQNVLALYSGFPSLISPPGFHDIDIQELSGAAGGVTEFVAEYRSDCTMLPTGMAYRNGYIGRFTVRDGKLAAFAEFFDPLVFLQAQGATVARPDA